LNNLNDNVTYFKLYEALDEYELPDLTPKSWMILYKNMESNNSLFEKYYNNMNPGRLEKCNNCSKSILCDIRYTKHDENKKCNEK
jgi:hypothetical protein